jgi:anti-sigma B factor antagonist
VTGWRGPGLRCETSIDGDVATIRFEGELDLATAPDAESAIERAEEEHGPAKIVLDLRGMRFLDSTGLRLILAADSRARRVGHRLHIVPGPEAVHRVFRIALLDRRLEFVNADGNAAS